MEDDIHHWSAPINVEDDNAEEAAFNSWPRAYVFAPTQEDAATVFTDITNILRPPRKKGCRYKSAGLDNVTRTWFEGMRMFLAAYVCSETDNPEKQGNWTEASNATVAMHCESKHHARKLCV